MDHAQPERRSNPVRRWAVLGIVAGFLLELAGLGLDAVLHTLDPGLAAEERLLATNPGHVLFLAGVGSTVLGVSMLLLSSLRQCWRPAPVILGALVIVAIGAASTSWSGDAGGQAHAAHESHAPGAAREEARAHPDGVPIAWGQLREVNRMLAEAKEATAKYRDSDVALADGYVPMTPVLLGLGAHWVNQELLDSGVFDVRRPQVLLYDYAANGGLELVGVSWALPGRAGGQPPSHFAPLAHWHEHGFAQDCIGTRGADLFQTLPIDEASCRDAGYVYFREPPWFLHAWLFRPSPQGVFSHWNGSLE